MSQILEQLHKADISFFGNLKQRERELQNHLDGSHEFTVHLSSANFADPLDSYQKKIMNDASIPFKDMSFLYNTKTVRTESLLMNWIAMQKSAFGGDDTHDLECTGLLTITDVDTTLQMNNTTDGFEAKGEINNDDSSILIGTGTTPVTLADNKLETKIVSGSLSGELIYQPSSVSAFYRDTNEASFRISRGFGNQSGSTISPKEVGVSLKAGKQGGGIVDMLVERTLSAVTVLDKENLVQAYSFKVTT